MTKSADAATSAGMAGFAIAECWGKGTSRRSILLRGRDGRVDAALEDHRHAMFCSLFHDGVKVTAVESEFQRYSLTHCAGAAAPLAELVGMDIGISTGDFFAGGRARHNCTHMLDLAWMALRHCRRGNVDWLFEIDIPDAVSGPARGTLRRNGEEVLDWTVENNVIVAPARYAGRAMRGGFLRWAVDEAGLSDQEMEDCLVLHKGFFVVAARQFASPSGRQDPAFRKMVEGVCYGYAPERLDDAVSTEGMFRDFSDHPERLLRFE
ncbi:DUF2889 domain-containing protein [Novosphingobium sp. KCTC 2891]|uniref:DUF2889 domain-containing protein n=1 Tax=Novosphingobium sp. KCTC 2891 TaxID=2989730 RepID=UPI002221C70D|nr:DUF2889 domain-containing protein [Novosphingobium sp. KCTC 2891]MCW1383604.1 DUF2889 domain-containing protein [Novosphingobium sp. KCTC 2891]